MRAKYQYVIKLEAIGDFINIISAYITTVFSIILIGVWEDHRSISHTDATILEPTLCIYMMDLSSVQVQFTHA